jgi:hypothetical protein
MALAILDLVDADETQVTFRIDTGTNTQYQLQVGSDMHQEAGAELLDDVYYTAPARQVEGGAGFFATSREVSVPLASIERGRSFAQLVTSKTGGKAHARSRVVRLSGAALLQSQSIASSLSVGFSGARVMSPLQAYRPARQVAHRGVALSRQASLESLLGEIVKIASPIVLNLLKDLPTAVPGTAASSSGANQAAAGGLPIETLVAILRSLIGSGAPPGAVVPSVAKSLTGSGGNRFSPGSGASFVKPFIFGIDDALIASLVGPVLQALPQLMNAANQKRLDLKKSDNALMGGILSDINKRLMMEQLADAQRAAQAQGPAAPITDEQLQALAALVGQLPAQSPTAGGAAAPATSMLPLARPKTLSAEAPPPDLSAKALLAFDFATRVEWNGAPEPVFDRTKPLTLKPRFTVIEPAPKAPLPKAILKVAVYDPANPATRYEKTLKLKDVLANSTMECRFDAGELAHLPPNCLLSVVGELRWKGARSGRETRALGSCEIVLVDRYFIKSRGAETSTERELKDMEKFRPFWNKVWEAPVLDGLRGGSDKPKYVWELNVNARYTTLLTGGHDANGVMETKLLTEADDPGRPTLSVHGRMKAGMELSLTELNKLTALWDGVPTLEAPKLDALRARSFLDDAAREFKYNFKLKGRAGQAGLIWVVPVFKLFGLTLSSVVAADDTGQVSATTEEDVQFPLPTSARLIGLKSDA